MAEDDEGDEGAAFDQTFAPAGPRRSTFTPPTGGTTSPAPPSGPLDDDALDDDALADALAADLTRITPGAPPTPPTPTPGPAPFSPPRVEPSAQYSTPGQGPAVEPEATQTAPPPVENLQYPPTPPSSFSPPSAAPEWGAPAPWSSLPAPDPAQAVQLPNPPERPARRSLPDDELITITDDATRGHSATLDMIERLQAELELREREARGLSDWGTTGRQGGAEPPATSTPAQEPPTTAQEPPTTAQESSAPAHEAPAGEPPAASGEPQAPPSFVNADNPAAWPFPTAPAEPQPAPPSARPIPPWEQPLPAWAPPQPDSRVFEPRAEGLPVPADPPIAPNPQLPAWEVPAPGPNWAPGPEYGIDAEPEVQAPSEPKGVEPDETAWDRQPWDQVSLAGQVPDDHVVETPVAEPVVAPPPPPPLIEPTQHGPALLPSEASGRAPLATDFDAPPTSPPIGLAPPVAESAPAPAFGAEAIFIEPMPVAAGEAVPTDTGSITLVDPVVYDEELPDDVDETDRIAPGLGAVSVDTAGVAVVTGAIHPPSGPIATVRVPEDEVVLTNGEPVRMKVFSLEGSGLEPTPVDQRVGRAARLFWLWFASNSSIVSLGLGATIFAVGMSLRQSVVSVLAGVALSFIPLGLTTLAGKRSGQPTMVVSRATFGLLGNVIPAILALVTRVFWGAVLLWVLASSVAIVLVGAALDGGLGDRQLLLISLAIAFLVALLVAFAGYPLFARVQLILSVVSGILVVGLIAITWKYVDFSAALTTPDGPWVLTISGAVLVFSFVGLVWANSGADLSRYQRPGSSGAGSMLWATIGTTLPTFLLIAYGALLAASDKGIATGLMASPLDTLSLMLPIWYPVPLLAATGLSLLSGVILTLYSGGFALQAIGLHVRRQWSIVIVALLLGGLALLLTFGVTGGIAELFRDAATTLAVPTAAWAGIFAAETMIRNRRFEPQSLLVRGGVYADVRWLNLIALILISVVGYGLTTASISWLSWQGYGFTLLGMPLDSDLAASDVGVLAALVLGLLVPLIAGVPAIRKQEALRPTA